MLTVKDRPSQEWRHGGQIVIGFAQVVRRALQPFLYLRRHLRMHRRASLPAAPWRGAKILRGFVTRTPGAYIRPRPWLLRLHTAPETPLHPADAGLDETPARPPKDHSRCRARRRPAPLIQRGRSVPDVGCARGGPPFHTTPGPVPAEDRASWPHLCR